MKKTFPLMIIFSLWMLAGCCKLSATGHGCETSEERAAEWQKNNSSDQSPPAGPVPPPFPQPSAP